MHFRGIVLQLAYRLRRHLWAGWPLSHWLGLLLLVGGLAALLHGQPAVWPAMVLGVSFVLYTALQTWAARCRYVRFETIAAGSMAWQAGPSPPPLGKGELVPVRASGWFTVEGRVRYYVEVKAGFETVDTGEHIIRGRIQPSRFLKVGHWPPDEVGWWYIFFQPAMIRDLSLGHLSFGRQPRFALCVIYTPDDEMREAVYLTSRDLTALRRVWDDLRQERPPDKATGTSQNHRP